jgi:hypothetical protein
VLLLMWSGGCTLAALASAALANGDGPLLVGVAAVVAAQVAIVAGRAAQLPSWAVWAPALACAAIGALGRHGASLLLYLALVAALLVVADRFAVLAIAFSGLSLPGAEDPIARELARARRDESRLAVASISAPQKRGGSRRLAHVARALMPSLRRTDAVVRAIADRLVVVLPGGDDEVAVAVLSRALADEYGDLCIGTATFPEDGPTWASLKEVARARERPWPHRFDRNGAAPAAQRARSASP